MKTNELRSKYLEFYKTKGHTVCPSDVMVPKWDNTVLFTPAGMNQFKDHFLGKVELEFTRAATAQKCLRTGDTENVGRTAYHHTFFEMLGNFSFGDYFKREAIHWAWEFLTEKQWLGMDPERLSVTVYLDDDEAFKIWNEEVGLPEKRITRLGEADNFWPASAPTQGPNGVCGPCSEIFFQPDNGPECEIWNLVFTQFNRNGDPPNNLEPLPSKNIDTGMGLERTAAVLQGCSTNYHIDTLMPIVEAAAEVCGTKYDPDSDNGRRLRRITDHVRAVSMAIHENVYPGANKEESVVRGLLRRAVLQGYEMGLRDPFLYQLVPVVVEQLKEPYPDLIETVDRVSSVIKSEEHGFYSLVDRAMPILETIARKSIDAGRRTINEERCAWAYQTHGIPETIAESVAELHGLGFDKEAFEKAMEKHGDESGGGEVGVMGDTGPIDDLKRQLKLTKFLGYEATKSDSIVKGLIQADLRQTSIVESEDSQVVVLDQTAFYAESGGQVGDTGMLVGPSGKFEVSNTLKDGDVFLHWGEVVEGEIREGDAVSAEVDAARRAGIERAHTATHILHNALQNNVGEHAQQRGSRVAADDLRFDFANMDPIQESVLVAIEEQTVARINESSPVKAEILPLESARELGAMMLFGEKYPDPVRMVSVGEFSKELCGGIHVRNTGEIEAFEITTEENVATGTRRIMALTGAKAKSAQQQTRSDVQAICKALGTDLSLMKSRVLSLAHQVKDLKKQIAAGRKSKSAEDVAQMAVKVSSDPTYFEIRTQLRETAQAMNTSAHDVAGRVEHMLSEIKTLNEDLEKLAAAADIDVDSLIENATTFGNTKLIAIELPGGNSGLMRSLIDQLRKKAAPIAVLLITKVSEKKVLIANGISRDLVEQGLHAGKWINEVASVVGGRGGGKPDMAQAGGSDPSKIADAIKAGIDAFAKMIA